MDFLSKMHVSELIWELPDLIWLIWQLPERKVSVFDGRSEDFKEKVCIFDGRDAHRCHHARGKHIFFLKNAGPPMQNLGYFRDGAELTTKVYLSMESKMYGFAKQNRVWQLLERKLHGLDGRSEDLKNKFAFSMGTTHRECCSLGALSLRWSRECFSPGALSVHLFACTM